MLSTVFTLACTPYSPGTRQPAHAHDDLQITLVLSGSLEERVGTMVERATALSVVVKDPGVVHDDRFGTTGALTARLTLGRTALADLVEHPSRALAWRWIHGGTLAKPFLRIVRHSVEGDRQFELDHDDVLDILAALSARLDVPTARGQPRWLADAVAGIRDGWCVGLTVRDVAGAAGVHPVYFARCVRRWYGVGAADLLRQARLRYAARHIADGDPTIATVAHAAGFADEPHLNREFSRVAGIPPARFRRLASAFERQRPRPPQQASANAGRFREFKFLRRTAPKV
jgi:AraC family transcriptional regulator